MECYKVMRLLLQAITDLRKLENTHTASAETLKPSTAEQVEQTSYKAHYSLIMCRNLYYIFLSDNDYSLIMCRNLYYIFLSDNDYSLIMCRNL